MHYAGYVNSQKKLTGAMILSMTIHGGVFALVFYSSFTRLTTVPNLMESGSAPLIEIETVSTTPPKILQDRVVQDRELLPEKKMPIVEKVPPLTPSHSQISSEAAESKSTDQAVHEVDDYLNELDRADEAQQAMQQQEQAEQSVRQKPLPEEQSQERLQEPAREIPQAKMSSRSLIPGVRVRGVESLRQIPGNEKPTYSTEDRKKGNQGVVSFIGYVESEGSLSKIKKIRTSGHSSLDQRSLDVVKNWKFYPGQEGWVEIPVRWTLNGQMQEVPGLLRVR